MPTSQNSWQQLREHYEKVGKKLDMRSLFSEDNLRFKKLSLKLDEPKLFLDYSKNLVTEETLSLLIRLAKEADVEGQRERMFEGEPINATEGRAVLHVALRNSSDEPVMTDGEDVMPLVREELKVMKRISEDIRSGNWKGASGLRITDVVNIGIGGSDLGPVMVCEALKHYADPKIKMHFVSNIDGTHLVETLKLLKPETTLFIIVSKTFTTAETMTNAQSAKDWFLNSGRGESDVSKHFVAVSTNVKATGQFGISPTNMVKFWDWVGGRYSLWSAVGLSIMISVGSDCFMELLSGAHAMDLHFKTAPLERNMPVMMALLGIWYNDFWEAQSMAVLPYEQYLHRLPAYLQQADMESNGKQVTIDGNLIKDYQTGPILWGEPGTNGQHAFFQLLHQGTKLIPADFIVGLKSVNSSIGNGKHHRMLLANCIAQTEALMVGKSSAQVEAELSNETSERRALLVNHKSFPGNRPTNTILYDILSPKTLGALVALYEHKIFVQGVIWHVNSFDQWGVELGKQLANVILGELDKGKITVNHDSSTIGLINHVLNQQL